MALSIQTARATSSHTYSHSRKMTEHCNSTRKSIQRNMSWKDAEVSVRNEAVRQIPIPVPKAPSCTQPPRSHLITVCNTGSLPGHFIPPPASLLTFNSGGIYDRTKT